MTKALCLVLSFLWGACAGPAREKSTVSQGDHHDSRPIVRSGKKVYEQYCLPCHQADGNGLDGVNPPLRGSEYVLGRKERMVQIVLQGSNAGLVVKGKSYSNAMPSHGFLSDGEVANVLSYIRTSFGNRADSLSERDVREVRKALIGH